jgi:hypothetical protein
MEQTRAGSSVPMSMRPIGVRLALFIGVLVLTLLPGLIVAASPIGLDGILGFLGYVWMWQILATLPVGIARVPFDGEIYFANSSEFVAVTFWLLVGLAAAVALRRLRMAYFAAAAFFVILGSGLGVHLILSAFGYAMFMRP